MSEAFEAYAAYYDLLYRDKDYALEAKYVHSLLTRYGIGPGTLLELGSGTGKHAEQMARLGYQVHGIDSSAPMVERARSTAAANPEANLKFEVADVRNVRLATQFDSVISLFHVASYQSTNQDLGAMFSTASAHLKPGGAFVFDFWYGPGVLTDRPSVRVKRLEDREVKITRIAEPTIHPNENLVDVRYTVFVSRKATAEPFEFQETHRMRYLFLPELELLLRSSGMAILNARCWLSGELGLTSWLGVITAGKPLVQAR